LTLQYSAGVTRMLDQAKGFEVNATTAQLGLKDVFPKDQDIQPGQARLVAMVAAALAAHFCVDDCEELKTVNLFAEGLAGGKLSTSTTGYRQSGAVVHGPIKGMLALVKGLCLLDKWLQHLRQVGQSKQSYGTLMFLHKSGAVPEKLTYNDDFHADAVVRWRKASEAGPGPSAPAPAKKKTRAYPVAEALLFATALEMPADGAAIKELASVINGDDRDDDDDSDSDGKTVKTLRETSQVLRAELEKCKVEIRRLEQENNALKRKRRD
jgi:hypothetical protein